MIHAGYAVTLAAVFAYGVSTYLRRRPKEVEDDGSDFAYIKKLHKDKLIDDGGFEALVILSNEPDIDFIRPEPQMVDPPKRRWWWPSMSQILVAYVLMWVGIYVFIAVV